MIKQTRVGEYKGKDYVFTHKDPRYNMVYSPDIKSFVDDMYGMWISGDKVKWKDEK